MKNRSKIHTIEMVRSIRDKQAEKLAGAAPEDVIAFFRRAGKASLQTASARWPKKVR